MTNNTIAIMNFRQACAYIKHGVKPVDIEYGKKGDLIFYFNIDDTKEIWERWKAHENLFDD